MQPLGLAGAGALLKVPSENLNPPAPPPPPLSEPPAPPAAITR